MVVLEGLCLAGLGAGAGPGQQCVLPKTSPGTAEHPRVRTEVKPRGPAVVCPLNVSREAAVLQLLVKGEVWVLLLRWNLWSLTCTAPQGHPHRLRVPLKVLLLLTCSLSTLRPHGLSHSGTKTEGLNSCVVWILEAVSQITCCNGHLAKSLQRIITCIFKLLNAAEIKLAEILRRTKINFPEVSHCNWFLYHCHKVIRSDAQDKK